AASLNLGTSATYVAPAQPGDAAVPGVVRSAHVLPGLEGREGTIPACGSVIDWLARLLGYPADEQGLSRLFHHAASAPAGAGGVRFVPALVGLGTPTWAGGHGWAHGIGLTHSPAHVARAALEGIALQFRHILVHLERYR